LNQGHNLDKTCFFPAAGVSPMLKQDKPQYTIDHDGNFLFVVKIEGEPRPDFVAVVEVKMEGKTYTFKSFDFLILIG
jgi:hypothetical protein